MKIERIIAFGIFLVLFIYLALRAIYTPLVHDEAATFFHYIHANSFWPYLAHSDANNHFINSWLAHICYQILGKSAFAIRLPNLLAFIPFAYFAWRLCKSLSTSTLRLLGFTALVSAQLVFEFFALARGYGLSMAFLLGMLYYLKQYLKEIKLYQLISLLVFMNLAIWSNLALSNTFLLLLVLLSVFQVIQAYKSKDSRLQIQGLITLVLGYFMFLIAAKYAFDLRERGGLYYGSLNGFIPVTYKSLAALVFGVLTVWKNAIVIVCVLLFISIGFWQVIKSRVNLQLSILSICLYFFVGNVLGAILLANFFQVNYPEDRAGLYFIPLLIIGFAYAVNELQLRYKHAIHFGWILLIFPIQTLLSANISHSLLWPGQTVNQEFYDYLKNEQLQSGKKMSIGSYHLQEMSWAFLNLNQPNQLSPTQRIEYPDYTCDYQIVADSLWYKMKNTHELILKDKGNGQLLLKNKYNVVRESEVRFKIPAGSKNAQDEFFGFYDRIGTDSLPKGAIQFDVNFRLSTDQQPFKAQLVFSAQDSLGNQLFYDFLPMHWLRSEWKSDRISLTRRFAALPPKTHRLIVYLWNIEKATFEIAEVEVIIANLK